MSTESVTHQTPSSRTLTSAGLLRETVDALSRRTPSIAAASAAELGNEVINFHFGDGSTMSLRRSHNRLQVAELQHSPTVECFFDDHLLRTLYDLTQSPASSLVPGSFDVRGPTESVLAAYRTFQLLSQRAAGLRFVQQLWTSYRAERALDRGSTKVEVSPFGKRYPMPDAAALLRKRTTLTQKSASVATTRTLWDGQRGEGWWDLLGPKDADLQEILDLCSKAIAREIRGLIPDREPRATLYDLMADYPGRGGKGLRPTLCVAACGAFGGQPREAVRIAAALEMFHNAFLIHDDIEDESDFRRKDPCLHVQHGIGLAVNAGDGLNLQALEAVLSNIPSLGLTRTLAMIHEIINMCRETIEGQALELGWIRHGDVPGTDEAYFEMATKKTGWYTCMSPCRLGATAAGHTRPGELDLLGNVFHKVGISFQIQDDLLNLLGKEELYGKEPLGDLLEGKRTLMLIHLMRGLRGKQRREVLEWLNQPRTKKRVSEAEWVLDLMHQKGSIEYGIEAASSYARQGTELFEKDLGFIPESEAKAVLRQVADYVNTREL